MEEALNNAAADCFYNKSYHEYQLLQENFRDVSKLIPLKTRRNLFPCYQYLLKNHEERNKIFNDMLSPPRREKLLSDEDRSNPVVTVDISKYMSYIMTYDSAKKCIKDRTLECGRNKLQAVKILTAYREKHKISDECINRVIQFIQSLTTDVNVSKEQVHELIKFMDSATMYSRAKLAREFHHNFISFGWLNLGLPLDWLALIPAGLLGGLERLQKVFVKDEVTQVFVRGSADDMLLS